MQGRRLGRLYAWQFGEEWRYANYRRGAPANAIVVGAKLHQFNER
jgi:hypothetical protein